MYYIGRRRAFLHTFEVCSSKSSLKSIVTPSSFTLSSQLTIFSPRLKQIFSLCVRLPTAQYSLKLTRVCFHLVVCKPLDKPSAVFNKFINESLQIYASVWYRIIICIIIKLTVFNEMKDVIDEDVEKDWSQNGSLRHTFEDWLKITRVIQ